jgi:hypothetical protein
MKAKNNNSWVKISETENSREKIHETKCWLFEKINRNLLDW